MIKIDRVKGEAIKYIVITPVYNEENVVVDVLNQISKYADILIIINDGSIDSSLSKIKTWCRGRKNTYIISFHKNKGGAQALKHGYAFVKYLYNLNKIRAEDLVAEIDSDGQHNPKYIPLLCKYFVKHPDIDVVLAQRDFAHYPTYKIEGNRFLTFVVSLLTGKRFNDVESNYRVTTVKTRIKMLDYLIGYRYSGSFESCIILEILKYKTDNNFVIHTPLYCQGTRFIDGVHVLFFGFLAYWKTKLGIKNKNLNRLIENAINHLEKIE